MDEQTLIDQYPKIYHMAEAGSWPLILKHGLLSTSALLDLLDCPEDERVRIEAIHRPQKVTLHHTDLGMVVFRDQKPMSDRALENILTDGTPSDWYRTLNSKVFFWPTLQRLLSFLGARAYRASDQIVIQIDTSKLVADYRDSIRLSPINSGATLYSPVARGANTFLEIAAYPYEDWKRKRTASMAVAEIAVVGGVTDITKYAIEMKEWKGTAVGETIWTQNIIAE